MSPLSGGLRLGLVWLDCLVRKGFTSSSSSLVGCSSPPFSCLSSFYICIYISPLLDRLAIGVALYFALCFCVLSPSCSVVFNRIVWL
ncbi:hypothetical protein BDZ89DRAFT_568372 [Hymenopellis radicata]|nr:hypothetical protein BDZ89DRAFT_568372 [Hymenopellis radicata]